MDFKQLITFKILQKISRHVYKLGLSASIKYHSVFHVLLLKATQSNPLKGQKCLLPTPIVVDNKQEYEAEEVIDSKLVQKKLYYLV